MTQPIHELSDRMREIFGLVVDAYLERGLPVGSKALAGSINLSSASIRGVMQELEEIGLLTHPHTSAGRVPTESGLRLFVDGIMRTAAPDPRETREIERRIVRDQPIEEALAAASAALSGLSQAAGVVLAPKREIILKQIELRRARARTGAGDPGRRRRQRREPHRRARRGSERRRAHRSQQLRQRALVGPDPGRGRRRGCAPKSSRAKEAIDSAAAELVALGPRRLEPGP